MKFSSFTFLSKEERPPLLKMRTYGRSSRHENSLMVTLRLRTRKEVPPVRKVKDEKEVEMIRAKLAAKLQFNFRETPNVCVTDHSNKKSLDVHSIQHKLCKRLNREADYPVTSYMAWDVT